MIFGKWYNGKGKELPKTRALQQRTFNEYGKGFVDIFILDAFYADQHDINLILSNIVMPW